MPNIEGTLCHVHNGGFVLCLPLLESASDAGTRARLLLFLDQCILKLLETNLAISVVVISIENLCQETGRVMS